jgi:protein-S-isoprenylcysteine O-methyltransferase Ste14
MLGINAFRFLLYIWISLAVVTFLILLYIPAPYGKHLRKGWGPNLSNRAGWIIMEAPSSLLMLGYFITGKDHENIALLMFLIMWEVHYINRSFIFPFRLRLKQNNMPVIVVLMAVFFNTANTYFNGVYLFQISSPYSSSWIHDPRFISGTALFAVGFVINQHADQVLFTIRKPGETGYKIPYGGLYRRISCPNYFGEILEWTGWAIATWSLAGVSFTLWTMANLIPRAIVNHRWYLGQFSDYPQNRKAVIPFII